MKRIHILYSGRVHGVGFRYTAVDLAAKHKILGWVKNTADGKVEVVAEGEEKVLDQFFAELEGILSLYILEKSAYSEPASQEFTSFSIKY
ncbi:MAG: acylphosphatase [Candidatus Margulisiibacteriota bacterium]